MLKLLTDLCEDKKLDYDSFIQLLEQSKPEDINVKTSRGENILTALILTENRPFIDALFDYPLDFNAEDNAKMTPLIAAILMKDGKTFEKLLSVPNIDLRIQSGHYGTALTCAIFMGRYPMAESILAREPDCSNEKHPGALYWAVVREQPELVRSLVAKGADLSAPKDQGYKSPEKWIWDTMPINAPFELHENAYTSIIEAVDGNQFDMVELLLELDPTLIDKVCNGTNPLLQTISRARLPNDTDMVELLLEYNANPDVEINGETIRSFVQNDPYVIDAIKELIPPAEESQHVTDEIIDKVYKGTTLLQAALRDCGEMADLLLVYGANSDVKINGEIIRPIIQNNPYVTDEIKESIPPAEEPQQSTAKIPAANGGDFFAEKSKSPAKTKTSAKIEPNPPTPPGNKPK